MRRYVVYAHHLDRVLIYIGMGTSTRPNSRSGRNPAWKSIVGARRVDVSIIAEFEDRDEAAERERNEIRRQKPLCNDHYNGMGHRFNMTPFTLTPAEEKGLELVRQGLSKKEINEQCGNSNRFTWAVEKDRLRILQAREYGRLGEARGVAMITTPAVAKGRQKTFVR